MSPPAISFFLALLFITIFFILWSEREREERKESECGVWVPLQKISYLLLSLFVCLFFQRIYTPSFNVTFYSSIEINRKAIYFLLFIFSFPLSLVILNAFYHLNLPTFFLQNLIDQTNKPSILIQYGLHYQTNWC